VSVAYSFQMSKWQTRLSALGVSVTLLFWLLVSFLSSSAALIAINYAKRTYKFKSADFVSLVQKASFILNLPPLFWAWNKYKIQPAWPKKWEFITYTFLGIVSAFETYLKSKAQIMLPGSTYLILFECDLIWNVLLSVTFLRRCYHPLQFISPCLIFGAGMMVSLSKENTNKHNLTGMGKFGGVILALIATFLTALGAVISDKILKMMMKHDVLEHQKENQAFDADETGLNQSTESDDITENLLERNMSKVWYQNKEKVRNIEFTFWSSFAAFLWLIVWTFADPKKEWKKWPYKFHRNLHDDLAIGGLMLLFSFSRLFVRLSMNHILMVVSAFFFSVWKPILQTTVDFDMYKLISVAMDVVGFLLFVWGGYLYKQQRKDKSKEILR